VSLSDGIVPDGKRCTLLVAFHARGDAMTKRRWFCESKWTVLSVIEGGGRVISRLDSTQGSREMSGPSHLSSRGFWGALSKYYAAKANKLIHCETHERDNGCISSILRSILVTRAVETCRHRTGSFEGITKVPSRMFGIWLGCVGYGCVKRDEKNERKVN
jgi:hypothetical protein